MVLKNEELKEISKAHTILGMLWAYAIDTDNDIYENIGVTIKDIHDSMRALNRIYTKQKLIKQKLSLQSTEYKKNHKERRNLIQNINNAKRKKDKKKFDYWTQKLNEFDNNKKVQ